MTIELNLPKLGTFTWAIFAFAIVFSTFLIFYHPLNPWLTIPVILWALAMFIKPISPGLMVVTYRLVLPILLGCLLLVLHKQFHIFVDIPASWDGTLENRQLSEFFLIISATLYAICIAFLLIKGLNDFDTLKSSLKDEANMIGSVLELFHYFDTADGTANGKQAHEIKLAFRKYIKNIMDGHRIQTNKVNMELLRQTQGCVGKIECEDVNDRIALESIMSALHDLVLIRSRRVASMENEMSPYLLAAVSMMALTVLIPFLLVDPTKSFLSPLYIFTLSTFFSFLFITLMDLSRPFDGYWSIKVDSFNEVLEQLEEELAAHTSENESNLQAVALNPA